ncbi:MAG: osmotically inducible protein C [Bacteroidales bacterium]|jgi:ribosomal protein S12 methylthiotransferase accessory factor|nr:osmotically inducible protein C [Bacteroidales bacterium]
MDMNIFLGENQRVEAHYKGFVIQTDQPITAGGDNSAPAPFDLFLASIGTCAGYYVKAFCNQRGIPTDGITLVQKTNHNKETRMIASIEINIHLPKDFPDRYRESVIKAANACAVKKHIANAPEFIVNTIIE